MSRRCRPRVGVRPNPRGQSGQSLIEVIVAMLLMGSMFGVVGAAIVVTVRGSTVNENQQLASSALVTYGEILQTQVGYFECPTPPAPYSSFSDAYYFATEPFLSGASLGNAAETRWRRPSNVLVSVLSVRSFNPTNDQWASGCASPDSGAQLIRYQVMVCKNVPPDQNPALCQSPSVRTGEIVKRKAGPS